MAEKVGKIHVHELPSELHLDVGDVYRCHCNVEFYVGKDKNDGTKGWWKVEDLVEYDRTVNGGQTFIGNATPETPWDSEEVNDDSATATGDASGDGPRQGGEGDSQASDGANGE